MQYVRLRPEERAWRPGPLCLIGILQPEDKVPESLDEYLETLPLAILRIARTTTEVDLIESQVQYRAMEVHSMASVPDPGKISQMSDEELLRMYSEMCNPFMNQQPAFQKMLWYAMTGFDDPIKPDEKGLREALENMKYWDVQCYLL